METNQLSLFQVMDRFANEAPKKSLFADEKRDYGAEAFQNAAVEVANALYHLGVRKGNLVCLRSVRSIDTMALYAALTYLGALTCLSDPHQGCAEAMELNGMLSDVVFLLTNERGSADLSAVGGWECVRVEDGKSFPIEIPLGKKKVDPAFDVRADIYAPSLIVFTSGSSNKAKGVTMSQYTIMNHLQNYAEAGSGSEEDCLLQLLPIHHVFGLCILLMAIWCRYRVYFAPSLDLDTTLNAIVKENVNACDSVPSFIVALAKAKEEKGLELPSLKYSLMGGANLLQEDIRYIEKTLNIRVFPVYGMSECIGIAGASYHESEEVRCHSVGHILPMCEVRFVDENNVDVPEGQAGEIIVRGPTVMMGYYNDEQGTREVIDEQGYLHTGDMGRLDEKGCLHIVGRKKEMIIRNGINISPAGIEEKVLNTGFFSEVAVVGIVDKKRGKVPAVAAVLKKGVLRKLALSEEDVVCILKNALLKIEIPAVAKILPSLPRLPSGKVDKVALKAMLSQLK